MRELVACLAKWDCQSFSCWRKFKECGQNSDGQSETTKLRRGSMEGGEEEEVKEESEGWKAPEV